MANYLDTDRDTANELLAPPKMAPLAEFRLISAGSHEKWEMVVGVISESGLYKKALSVELVCHRTNKPFRENYKFSLFYREFGRSQRVYQLDTTSTPLVDVGDHDWPHQHIGRDRISFEETFPINFNQSIAYFCKATNIKFDERIISPFDFSLRPS